VGPSSAFLFLQGAFTPGQDLSGGPGAAARFSPDIKMLLQGSGKGNNSTRNERPDHVQRV